MTSGGQGTEIFRLRRPSLVGSTSGTGGRVGRAGRQRANVDCKYLYYLVLLYYVVLSTFN